MIILTNFHIDLIRVQFSWCCRSVHTQPHDVLGIVVKVGNSGSVGEGQFSISLCCGTGEKADIAIVTLGSISRTGNGIVDPETSDVAGGLISTLDVPGECNVCSITRNNLEVSHKTIRSS